MLVRAMLVREAREIDKASGEEQPPPSSGEEEDRLGGGTAVSPPRPSPVIGSEFPRRLVAQEGSCECGKLARDVVG
jgi:hypothetical protein